MDFRLDVSGAVKHPLSLSLDAIRHNYPIYTVSTQFIVEDCMANTTFTGARLWDILLAAQVNDETSATLRVMARAADRFRCLLRWHEINPTTSDRLILVAYEQDGAPLSAKNGPLRLAVPGDERGRRYLRGLTWLMVLDRDEDDDEG